MLLLAPFLCKVEFNVCVVGGLTGREVIWVIFHVSQCMSILYFIFIFFFLVALEVTADSWDDIGGFKKNPDT